MPFSHHSHSGQFCPGHAQNTLEEMVKTAISKKMQVICLSEHMPRHDQDRYPEEIDAGQHVEWHFDNEAKYYAEACRLRAKYRSEIQLPVGFECDWIRPESLSLIQRSLNTYDFDFFIGSVHHVHTIPIDFDHEMYRNARHVAGGSDEELFRDYFDAQLAMLQALKPPIVGHFDLIRLKSDNPNQSFSKMSAVWPRILRNLEFVASYGGILELNFAAIRKGMHEPYPKLEICKEFVSLGGRFCLSDDSHAVEQIAFNYQQAPKFLNDAGITALYYLEHADTPAQVPHDSRFPKMHVREIAYAELLIQPFWEHDSP